MIEETTTPEPELTAADAPTTPDQPAGRGRRWLLPLLVLALVLAVAGTGAAAWLLLRHDDKAPRYPDAWDPKVLPFVHSAETGRDLAFLHPIYVDFLPDQEFEDQVRRDKADLTDEDRKQIEQGTGLLRAIGLLEGDVDLFDQMNDLEGASTIGYYSYDDKRIRVRGTELTPTVKLTLVHELTHAIQDQHFDLKARFDSFKDTHDEGEEVFRSIVEGDAKRVEQKYREGLSQDEQQELAKAEAEQGKTFEGRSKDIPQILQTFMGAPYALGERLLASVVERDGEGAVDDLFWTPPTHSEQLLDPWTLGTEDELLPVPPIELEDGETPIDMGEGDDGSSGEFGSLTWYLMLSERVPVTQALDATDGWAGDAFLQFEKDGRSCVRVGYRGQTDADLAQMRSALQSWTAAAPGAPASVEDAGDGLVFESCDPGTTQHVGKDRSREALTLAIVRTNIGTAVAKQSSNGAFARCYADGVVHTYTLEEIEGFDRTGLTDADRQELERISEPCR